MSDCKWRRLEQALGVDVKVPTRGIELPVVHQDNTDEQQQSETKPKAQIKIQQRRVIKADDPYL